MISVTVNKFKITSQGLATLIEGAGCFFFKVNSKVNSFILLWWKKCEKLAKKWIIVINGVSTNYLWKKNQEKV